MPTDAVLAIVSTPTVGLAGAGASIAGVFKTTSAQDGRERAAVNRCIT
jgi:hypothetical protein